LRYKIGEARKAVIAALEDHLAAAGIARDGLTVVEHLVAGFDQQQVARGRDTRRFERAQLFDVLGVNSKISPVWKLAVRADQSVEQAAPSLPG
jgi:hypothetical protein